MTSVSSTDSVSSMESGGGADRRGHPPIYFVKLQAEGEEENNYPPPPPPPPPHHHHHHLVPPPPPGHFDPHHPHHQFHPHHLGHPPFPFPPPPPPPPHSHPSSAATHKHAGAPPPAGAPVTLPPPPSSVGEDGKLYLGCKKEGCNGILCVASTARHGAPYQCPRCLNKQKYCYDCQQLYINFRRHRKLGHELYEFQRKRQVLVRNECGLFVPGDQSKKATAAGSSSNSSNSSTASTTSTTSRGGGGASSSMAVSSGGGRQSAKQKQAAAAACLAAAAAAAGASATKAPRLPRAGQRTAAFDEISLEEEEEEEGEGSQGVVTGVGAGEVGEELDDASDILVKLMQGSNKRSKTSTGATPAGKKKQEAALAPAPPAGLVPSPTESQPIQPLSLSTAHQPPAAWSAEQYALNFKPPTQIDLLQTTGHWTATSFTNTTTTGRTTPSSSTVESAAITAISPLPTLSSPIAAAAQLNKLPLLVEKDQDVGTQTSNPPSASPTQQQEQVEKQEETPQCLPSSCSSGAQAVVGGSDATATAAHAGLTLHV